MLIDKHQIPIHRPHFFVLNLSHTLFHPPCPVRVLSYSPRLVVSASPSLPLPLQHVQHQACVAHLDFGQTQIPGVPSPALSPPPPKILPLNTTCHCLLAEHKSALEPLLEFTDPPHMR